MGRGGWGHRKVRSTKLPQRRVRECLQKEDLEISKVICAALKLSGSLGEKTDRLDRALVGHAHVAIFSISITAVHPNILVLLTCIYFVNVHQIVPKWDIS